MEATLEAIRDLLDDQGLDKISIENGQVKACCPFHDERTPSFYVHPEKGWWCFGCAKGGSLKALSRRFGADEFEDSIEQSERDHVFDFLDEVEEPAQVFNPRLIDTYRTDNDYFVRKWNTSREVAERRMLRLSDDAELFPLFDLAGDFLGFVERKEGKPRSIYRYPKGLRKSDHLLGATRNMRDVWVVEGVRDLCRVEAVMGVDAVALGTATPSSKQIELLRHYDSVVVCLDNDDAGKKGRNILRRSLPMNSTSVAAYEGKDPQSADTFDVISLMDLFLNDFV